MDGRSEHRIADPLQVGNVPPRRDLYTPFFSDFIHHVSSPTYKRSHLPSESEEAYSLRLASELEAKILELGAENIMAFVAEPVVGAALGVMPPPKGYFPAINAVVRKHNLLFVMDEVMSGSGRVGELFAHDAVAESVTPDIMAMAKGLGAGYVTISAVLVNARVAEVVREAGQWKNSHTYQNHPVNCAVAKKVMEITEREGLMQNVKARGTQLLEELTAALEGVKGVYDVRGKGLVSAVQLHDLCTFNHISYAISNSNSASHRLSPPLSTRSLSASSWTPPRISSPGWQRESKPDASSSVSSSSASRVPSTGSKGRRSSSHR